VLAFLFLLAIAQPNRVDAQFSGFHLSFATANLLGPDGESIGHVGDSLDFQATVYNFDEFFDTIGLQSVLLVIQHGNGLVTTTNLVTDEILAPFFGAYAEATCRIWIQPEDGDSLGIDTMIVWVDHWDGGQRGLAWPSSAAYSFSVPIVRPGMDVVQQTHTAPVYPFMACDGYVTNTGNALLTNIVVTTDNGTPEDPTDDGSIAVGSLEPSGSMAFHGNYVATGSATTNTVSVFANDRFGRRVTCQLARTISVALNIVRSTPGSIKLTWPNWAEGYRLESRGDLNSEWNPVNRVPTLGEGDVSVTLPVSTNQFYRLARP